MAIVGGQIPLASDINAILGAPVILDADQTVNNSTTLVSSGLVVALAANSKYALETLISFDTNATADFKYNFLLPAGATITHSMWGSGTAMAALDATIFHDRVAVATLNAGGFGAGTVMTICPRGTIRTSSTAGNVTFQFAQVTANASNTILKADSWIKAQKG